MESEPGSAREKFAEIQRKAERAREPERNLAAERYSYRDTKSHSSESQRNGKRESDTNKARHRHKYGERMPQHSSQCRREYNAEALRARYRYIALERGIERENEPEPTIRTEVTNNHTELANAGMQETESQRR